MITRTKVSALELWEIFLFTVYIIRTTTSEKIDPSTHRQCYRDYCRVAEQFCDGDDERCHWCSDLGPNLCDTSQKGDVPPECLAGCYKQELSTLQLHIVEMTNSTEVYGSETFQMSNSNMALFVSGWVFAALIITPVQLVFAMKICRKKTNKSTTPGDVESQAADTYSLLQEKDVGCDKKGSYDSGINGSDDTTDQEDRHREPTAPPPESTDINQSLDSPSTDLSDIESRVRRKENDIEKLQDKFRNVTPQDEANVDVLTQIPSQPS